MKIKYNTLPAILLILSFTRIYINAFYGVYMFFRILILLGLLISYIKYLNLIDLKLRIIFFSFMCVALATTINQNMGFAKIFQCIIFFLTILSIFLVVCYYKYTCKETLFIKTIFKTLLLLCIVSDFVSLFQRDVDYYLLGSKFMVSYIHLLIIYLWQTLYLVKPIKKVKYRFTLIFLMLESLFMFNWVHCTTAVLLFPFTIIAPFCTYRLRNLLQNRNILFLVYGIGNFMVLGMGVLANNMKVYYFITQVLDKGASFIGRLIIYEKIAKIIEVKPLLGYGYMSDIVNQVVTFGNAQNGFLDMIIQYGVIGLSLWLIFIYFSCKSMKNEKYWPICVFIYSLILASLIEIPFNLFFYLAIAIIAIFGNEKVYKNNLYNFGYSNVNLRKDNNENIY